MLLSWRYAHKSLVNLTKCRFETQSLFLFSLDTSYVVLLVCYPRELESLSLKNNQIYT